MKKITIEIENNIATVESTEHINREEFSVLLKALIKLWGNQKD